MRDVALLLAGWILGAGTILLERRLRTRDATEAEARKVVLTAQERFLMAVGDSHVSMDDATFTNGSASTLRHVEVTALNNLGETATGKRGAVSPGDGFNVPVGGSGNDVTAVATFSIDEVWWRLDHLGRLRRVR